MEKAFEIVKLKASETLKTAINHAMSPKLVIHAAELKVFKDFVEEIINSRISLDLKQYVNYINYNKFLKITLSDEVQKLDEELKFLAPFTQIKSVQHNPALINWSHSIEASALFGKVLDETKSLINISKDLFSAFHNGKAINTIGYSGKYSKKIKESCDKLYDKYKEKAGVESLKDKTTSKYYFNQTVQKYDGMERKPYQDKEPYPAEYVYYESVPYKEYEPYTVEVSRTGWGLFYFRFWNRGYN